MAQQAWKPGNGLGVSSPIHCQSCCSYSFIEDIYLQHPHPSPSFGFDWPFYAWKKVSQTYSPKMVVKDANESHGRKLLVVLQVDDDGRIVPSSRANRAVVSHVLLFGFFKQ